MPLFFNNKISYRFRNQYAILLLSSFARKFVFIVFYSLLDEIYTKFTRRKSRYARHCWS